MKEFNINLAYALGIIFGIRVLVGISGGTFVDGFVIYLLLIYTMGVILLLALLYQINRTRIEKLIDKI